MLRIAIVCVDAWWKNSQTPRGSGVYLPALLLIPKCIKGEWRWGGFQRIEQVTYEGMSCGPDVSYPTTLKWRSIAWVDEQTDTTCYGGP